MSSLKVGAHYITENSYLIRCISSQLVKIGKDAEKKTLFTVLVLDGPEAHEKNKEHRYFANGGPFRKNAVGSVADEVDVEYIR